MTALESPGLGLYVHWPYCARICPYCDFNVYRARDRDAAPLVRAMHDDLVRWRARTGPRRLASLHFGGGTPSLMSPGDVAAVIAAAERLWGFEAGAEIGLEANPHERAAFADLVAAGVERLSVGVQALDDASLAALGRDHDAAGALEALELARRAAPRVSADLIYAREGQTPAGWAAELNRLLDLGLDHLSLYQLTIEPGTAFAKRRDRGGLVPPGDDSAAAMFETAQAMTEAAGLSAYEISNHARGEPHRSVHNRLYWTGGDWIGVGPGAHSRLGAHALGGRLAAIAAARPDDYIAGVGSDGGHAVETLDPLAEAQERVLAGLRVVEGLDRAALRASTGCDIDQEAAERFAAEGLVDLTDGRVALTPAGRLWADRVAIEIAPD